MMNTAKSFTSVLDGRKRKVRNLWQRGDRFYARIKIAYPGEDRAKTRRVPLKAGNVTAAVKELRELLVKRDKGRTITRERTQTLADFAACLHPTSVTVASRPCDRRCTVGAEGNRRTVGRSC